MNNLMTATLSAKQDILEELRQGNTAILKGLPPVKAMQYGLALQNEVGHANESSIDNEGVVTAMLERMDDSDAKERLIKKIEENKEVTG